MFQELTRKRALLESIIAQTKKRLANAPAGSLHVAFSHGYPQYRLRLGSGQGEVRLEDHQERLKRQLAQKAYDRKILKAAEKELRLVNAALDNGAIAASAVGAPCSETSEHPALQTNPLPRAESLEQVYQNTLDCVKHLITPCVLPDKEFIEAWEAARPEGPALSTEGCVFQTEKGNRVRSKSECIIADKLFRAGVPYRYEQPLVLQGAGTVHPDFVVLNPRTRQEFAWEHFGMMEDSEYANRALRKLGSYAGCGLFPGHGMIATFESVAMPLDVSIVEQNIQEFLT
ncbi:MAG: hypothetical protein Q4E12_01640 [Coriobacteriia bacterium]|nr:hypothetical protein [Coriobacteriia bacterium]